MNKPDAQETLAYCEGLFPKWNPTAEIRALWVEYMMRSKRPSSQWKDAIARHKEENPWPEPVWRDADERKGSILRMLTRKDPALPTADYSETDEDRRWSDRRTAAQAWWDSATQTERDGLTDRTIAHLRADGDNFYADLIEKRVTMRTPFGFTPQRMKALRTGGLLKEWTKRVKIGLGAEDAPEVMAGAAAAALAKQLITDGLIEVAV